MMMEAMFLMLSRLQGGKLSSDNVAQWMHSSIIYIGETMI